MSDLKYDGRDLEAMSFARNYHEWILSLFTRFISKRVAEVGAGSGSFTELLLKESVEEIVAVEPSSEMYARLEKNTAHDTRVVCKNEFFADVSPQYLEYFDSVVYVNVLEHVEDDASELAHVYSSLKPGGYVCIFVPALMWLYSAHDKHIGHFRRYHKAPLKALVQSAGFEVVRVRYFDIVGVLPWFVLMTLLKTHPAAGSVDFYDRVVVPLSRVFESIVPLPFGKNLLIVGRKPA